MEDSVGLTLSDKNQKEKLKLPKSLSNPSMWLIKLLNK
jgi:hypothetical protein